MPTYKIRTDILGEPNERCKTPDNNKVDSILICEYMKRNY